MLQTFSEKNKELECKTDFCFASCEPKVQNSVNQKNIAADTGIHFPFPEISEKGVFENLRKRRRLAERRGDEYNEKELSLRRRL